MSLFGFGAASAGALVAPPVDVKTDVKAHPEKAPKVVHDTIKIVSRAHRSVKGGYRKNGQVAVAVLTQTVNATSGANAALGSVFSLSPVGVQDWTSFAAVYDLARVKSIKAHIRTAVTAGAVSAPGVSWAVSFDYGDSHTHTNVPDAITAKHHIGPCTLAPQGTAGTVQQGPGISMTKSGFYTLAAKLEPKAKLTSDTVTGLVGGGWIATDTTTAADAVIGFLKPFIPAAGTGVTTYIEYYVEYLCEFKWRD